MKNYIATVRNQGGSQFIARTTAINLYQASYNLNALYDFVCTIKECK